MSGQRHGGAVARRARAGDVRNKRSRVRVRSVVSLIVLLNTAPAAAQFVEEALSSAERPVTGTRVEIEPSGTLSPEQARQGRAERQAALRERYELWLEKRRERPRNYGVPELPPEIQAAVPAPPDAPDGEITRERLDNSIAESQ